MISTAKVPADTDDIVSRLNSIAMREHVRCKAMTAARQAEFLTDYLFPRANSHRVLAEQQTASS